MLSTTDIVNWINSRLAEVMPGVKTYDIAKQATKDGKTLPYIDEKYIGVDDTYPAQVYHRQLSIGSGSVRNSSFGDGEDLIQTTTQMSMVVFYNEKKAGILPDQLYSNILLTISGSLKSPGHKSVRVMVVNAILNDSAVWAQEYGQTPYALSGAQRLILINYSIVTVSNQACIEIHKCFKN